MVTVGVMWRLEFFEQLAQKSIKKARRLGGLKVQENLNKPGKNLFGLTVVGRFAV
jgi:hypothetical protein